jgi:hypothetical protein
MSDPDRNQHAKVLAKLRDSPRLPAELWERFRETARRRGEPWIDALRRIIERYVHEHTDEGTRHENPQDK